MSVRFTTQGAQSKLLEIPVNSDPKQALLTVQKNFDIVWKTLQDIRVRLDSQPK